MGKLKIVQNDPWLQPYENAIEGRYEYELSLAKGVKDFAGKEAEKDVFVFDGTDLAPSQK